MSAGYGVGLTRLQVQSPAVPLSDNNFGHVRRHVPLSQSSIICYRSWGTDVLWMVCFIPRTDGMSNDYVHNRYLFSPNVACDSEMLLVQRLQYMRQTGNKRPFLEVWDFFRLFVVFGLYLPRFSTDRH